MRHPFPGSEWTALLALILAFGSNVLPAAQDKPILPANSSPASTQTRTGASLEVDVKPMDYHGWTNAYRLANGIVEAIVVPAIGRVMQFSFVGEEGVFWENRDLDGHLRQWNEETWRKTSWINFGGDKTWPSPEQDWSDFTRRDWRPPPAFDGMPAQAKIVRNGLMLISSVDPFYGIRIRRAIRLIPHQPIMRIQTQFERVSGEPAKLGIWVVTQFKEPVSLFLPIPKKSQFPNNYCLLISQPPPSLQSVHGLLSLGRNPKAAHKIGSDADSMLWVGDKVMCLIDSPRVPDAEYPDLGSSVEIYTAPDPLPYIELETLGPLQTLKPGEKIKRLNTYTLQRRVLTDPTTDARRVFALHRN